MVSVADAVTADAVVASAASQQRKGPTFFIKCS